MFLVTNGNLNTGTNIIIGNMEKLYSGRGVLLCLQNDLI